MFRKSFLASALIAALTSSVLAQSATTGGNSTLDTSPSRTNAGGTVGSEGIARPDPGVTNSVTNNDACKTLPGTTAQRPKTPGSQAEPQPQARCQNK